MREYELIIDEHLKNGLSPFEKTPFNSKLLEECLGYRCGNAGLEIYEQKENPFSSAFSIAYNWPFPQVIIGERYNVLVVRDDSGDNVYIFTDDHSLSLAATITQGNLLQVADFGEYIFMTNGSEMIYWDVVSSSWISTTSITTIPLMSAICNFNGQAIGGNISSDWYDCDETYYVWSKIGEMNFTPEQDNMAGYRRCPFGGEVYHTKKLGKFVIGYSSKGLTAIVPVSEPAATFGFSEMSDVGLINQGALNGSIFKHVYVDSNYHLKEVTNDGVKDLGYKSYIEQLAGADIIVNYDKLKKDFYISNGEKSFLYSPNGLSEIPQHPSAVWSLNGSTYILPDSEDDFEHLITSAPFNMLYGGQKTVFSAESDAHIVSSPEMAVEYTNDLTSWNSGNYKPMNNQGVVALIASGNAFKIKLKSKPMYEDSLISYIKIRYKMTDLRGIRGVYASPPRGQ